MFELNLFRTLGGILEPDYDQYMTDSKRAHLGLKTSKDQLTLNKQQLLKVQEGGAVAPPVKPDIQEGSKSSYKQSPSLPAPQMKENVIQPKGNSRSLLADMGSSLLYDIPHTSFPGHNKPIGKKPVSIGGNLY